MGATSSVSNKIYKHIGCGCIYCFDSEIQLLYSCYNCLEILRKTKTLNKANILQFEVENNSIDILLSNLEWKTLQKSIQYAIKNNILLEEFISNENILHNF